MNINRKFTISERELENMILELESNYDTTIHEKNKLLYKGGSMFLNTLLNKLIIDNSIKREKKETSKKQIIRKF